jgi:hypothetical protein
MAHPSPRIFGQNRRTRPRPFARCQSRCVPDDFWRKQGIVSHALVMVLLLFASGSASARPILSIRWTGSSSTFTPIQPTARLPSILTKAVGSLERRLQLDDPMPYLCRDQPGKDGDRVFEATASFIIDHTTDQPISLRINNERAAFEGRLALGSVTLTPQPNRRPEIPHELQIALGQ